MSDKLHANVHEYLRFHIGRGELPPIGSATATALVAEWDAARLKIDRHSAYISELEQKVVEAERARDFVNGQLVSARDSLREVIEQEGEHQTTIAKLEEELCVATQRNEEQSMRCAIVAAWVVDTVASTMREGYPCPAGSRYDAIVDDGMTVADNAIEARRRIKEGAK